MDEALCCRLLACCSVQCDRSVLPEAISSEPASTRSTWPTRERGSRCLPAPSAGRPATPARCCQALWRHPGPGPGCQKPPPRGCAQGNRVGAQRTHQAAVDERGQHDGRRHCAQRAQDQDQALGAEALDRFQSLRARCGDQARILGRGADELLEQRLALCVHPRNGFILLPGSALATMSSATGPYLASAGRFCRAARVLLKTPRACWQRLFEHAQALLHPVVGGFDRRGFGLDTSGPFRMMRLRAAMARALVAAQRHGPARRG